MVATPSTHKKFIDAAARKHLKPLGCVQKGKSRVWIWDRSWYLGLVEFQPSGFSKGSYLNVCVHLLWRANPGWMGFDIYQRAPGFISYVDDPQFEPLADQLGQEAATRLSALVGSIQEPIDVLPYLNEERVPSWQTWHAAIAHGLAGQMSDAENKFTRLIEERPSSDSDKQLQTEARKCQEALCDADRFRKHVNRLIRCQREALKLPTVADPLQSGAPHE